MLKAELRGGPWCGVEIPAPLAARWLWLEGSPARLDRPHIHCDPATGRMLYRRQDAHPGQIGYEFAGYLFTDCPNCGLVHARRDDRGRTLKDCSLCGANLSHANV